LGRFENLFWQTGEARDLDAVAFIRAIRHELLFYQCLIEHRVATVIRMHAYEVRPRKDHRGVDLVSDALPFGRLWYGEPNAVSNAIGYAKFYSRSHCAVIRVDDAAGNVIATHEQAGDFKEW
jgi:hypothetical protein